MKHVERSVVFGQVHIVRTSSARDREHLHRMRRSKFYVISLLCSELLCNNCQLWRMQSRNNCYKQRSFTWRERLPLATSLQFISFCGPPVTMTEWALQRFTETSPLWAELKLLLQRKRTVTLASCRLLHAVHYSPPRVPHTWTHFALCYAYHWLTQQLLFLSPHSALSAAAAAAAFSLVRNWESTFRTNGTFCVFYFVDEIILFFFVCPLSRVPDDLILVQLSSRN